MYMFNYLLSFVYLYFARVSSFISRNSDNFYSRSELTGIGILLFWRHIVWDNHYMRYWESYRAQTIKLYNLATWFSFPKHHQHSTFKNKGILDFIFVILNWKTLDTFYCTPLLANGSKYTIKFKYHYLYTSILPFVTFQVNFTLLLLLFNLIWI